MGLLEMFLPGKDWHLEAEETGDELVGQFPFESLVEDISNNWARHKAFSREGAIKSYVSGDSSALTFTGRFRARDAVFNDVEQNLNLLKKFARRDPDLGRPPILNFWVGNGFLAQRSVIDSVSGITYSQPTALGELREVTFRVALEAWEDFDIDDVEIYETRYHRAREGDYYEWLAQREYGNPNLGVNLRQRHPDQAHLEVGDTAKLPSAVAIRTERQKQQSHVFGAAFGRKDTATRRLRIAHFKERSASRFPTPGL